MSEYKNVLIVGELDNGHFSTMTLELIGAGAKLSRGLNQELYLAVFGKETAEIGKGYGLGVHRVYAACDPLLSADYAPDAYLQAMEQLVRELKPAVIIFGQTDKGIDLAPKLAFRLKGTIALDCVDLKTGPDGRIEQTKPVFGGKAHAVYVTDIFPQVVSIREGSFVQVQYDQSKQGEVIPIKLNIDPKKIRIKLVRKIQDDSLSLAAALVSSPIVVSGGRGLKGKEGFELLKETATAVGGAVGGSRPAIDNGWLPSHLQVGLTGKRVNPQVYMAVGISGALQHMAGCMKSKVIIAVNSDKEAPIFSMAHVGVVGDYKEVLEGFNEEMRMSM